ncbi:hypothetical protein [Fervidobacterium thailandense]|uniref:Uncharacterized protein n=1 Tax=Fervidobacterium thailandense TaxID=1008305 RepID=A0A1E3G3Q2_9BACT|nr:hypothetical protein [Fervidobacterium thailandense]ODN30901.1 hypothetical protein A4H02_03300 [Fervidobacterium thailandense]
MRIAREIIETLRMELGFLKYNSVDLALGSRVFSIQPCLQPSVSSLSMSEFSLGVSSSGDLHPEIREAGLSKESYVNVRELAQPSVSDLSVRSLDFDESFSCREIQQFDFKFECGLNFYEKGSSGFEPNVLKVNLEVENPIFHKNDTSFNLKTREARCRIVNERVIVNTNPKIELIYTVLRKPEDFVERHVILDTLKSLKTKYDISSLKFYGYYKYVPLEHVKMMKINPKGYLTIFLDPEVVKYGVRFQRLVNIVVFRYGDRFVYHVVTKT